MIINESIVCKYRGKVYIHQMDYHSLIHLERRSGQSLRSILSDVHLEHICIVAYVIMRKNKSISRFTSFDRFLRGLDHITVEAFDFDNLSIDDFLGDD